MQEECAAQNQKLQGQNAALEEECGKLRAGAEQHLLQVEAARERLQAADKKLEEEEQRRLQEVKELQVGPCCRALQSPRFVLSNISKIVPTNLQYFHLRVPSCRPLSCYRRTASCCLQLLWVVGSMFTCWVPGCHQNICSATMISGAAVRGVNGGCGSER